MGNDMMQAIYNIPAATAITYDIQLSRLAMVDLHPNEHRLSTCFH